MQQRDEHEVLDVTEGRAGHGRDLLFQVRSSKFQVRSLEVLS
jgi:hypothetical protein